MKLYLASDSSCHPSFSLLSQRSSARHSSRRSLLQAEKQLLLISLNLPHGLDCCSSLAPHKTPRTDLAQVVFEPTFVLATSPYVDNAMILEAMAHVAPIMVS